MMLPYDKLQRCCSRRGAIAIRFRPPPRRDVGRARGSCLPRRVSLIVVLVLLALFVIINLAGGGVRRLHEFAHSALLTRPVCYLARHW